MVVKDFLELESTAWVSVILSSICYGSSYIVTKRYPTGNGLMFAWAMSMGSLIVGFFCSLFNKLIFVNSGILGGSLWGVGNLMTIIAIRLIGLGPAYSIWCIACLVSGWLCGRLGAFGIAKPDIKSEALNILGALIGVSAIIVFYYVRKDEQLEERDWDGYEEYRPKSKPLAKRGLENDFNGVPGQEIEKSSDLLSFLDNLEKTPKQILGVLIATLIGLIYGFTGIPNQLWYEDKQDKEDEGGDDDYTPLDFVFSQFMGIFLFMNFVFIVHIIFTKNKPEMFPETILPSMVCGIIWAVASALNFISNSTLSYGISFPMVCMGPVIVTALWSILYFREITHPKHIGLLVAALVLNLIAVLFIAFSV